MPKGKVVKTKVALEWYFASWYFELLSYMIQGELVADEHFQRLYKELNEYIGKRIEPSATGDIVDTYVIIEQKDE
ncbi:MAG: hypothetical protein E7352_02175 [Clostridiales bacterium]|nr:hypothetical protein [Clostridiales bacterium]